MFSYLERERDSFTLDFDNSVWFQKDYDFNLDCFHSLAEYYFTSSYEADFKTRNEEIGEEIGKYVSDKTRGLLNPKFNLSDLTRLILLNTLYLKDRWIIDDELKLSQETYTFTNEQGEEKETKLIESPYRQGRIYEEESFKSFFITSSFNFKVTFIVPNVGNSLKDVMNEENITFLVNKTNYDGYDYEGQKSYKTRVLFPEFEVESIGIDLIDLTKKSLGINEVFSPLKANFEKLLGSQNKNDLYVTNFEHGAKLIVNQEGLEGGAYTIVEKGETGAPVEGPILSDFVVDKSFGFILSYYDTNLMTGIINNI